MRRHRLVIGLGCSLAAAGLLLAITAGPAVAVGDGPPSHSVVPREGTFGVDDYYRPKDFAIHKSGNDYHVIHIRVDRRNPNPNEVTFGHWRSTGNLHSWVQRPTISLPLPQGFNWNAEGIWAPSIVKVGSTFYMFFSGVHTESSVLKQRIGIATSTDLDNWTALANPVYECIASPQSPPWASCGTGDFRDSYIFPDPRPVSGSDTPGWLMTFTARPNPAVVPGSVAADFIVGLAQTGPQHNPGPNVLLGPWTDAGYFPATLSATTGNVLTESSHLFYRGNYWYMIHTGNGGAPGGVDLFLYTRQSAANSFGTDNWVFRGKLSQMLGINTTLWYASEYYKDPDTGLEYLGTVHQSLDNAPGNPPYDTSVIDFRRIVWGADWQFSLVDPNPPPQLTRWVQATPSPSPSARQQSAMAYDGPNRRMLLFGGTTAGAPLNDVWSLSLTAAPTWTQVTTAGTPPSARRAASAAYDSVNRVLYVFGGYASVTNLGTPLQDLYKLTLPASGTPTWTLLSSSLPGYVSAYGKGMVFDRLGNRLIVVDGTGIVWQYPIATQTWTNLEYGMGGAAGGFNFATAYDPVRDRVLVFGGWLDGPIPSLNNLNGVNAFYLSGPNANQWHIFSPTGTAPAGRSLTASAYDTERDQLVIHGGWAQTSGSPTLFADSWALAFSGSASAWSQITTSGSAPAARSGAAGAFEQKFDRMMTFGGAFASGVTSLLASLHSDVVAPAQVGFNANVHCESIDFTWTEPGDDGNVGVPQAFEMRRSSALITEANWNSAGIAITGYCSGQGQQELITLNLGACSQKYYYAVKVRDEAFNWSPLSNVTPKIGTPCPGPGTFCFEEGTEYAAASTEISLASSNPSGGRFVIRWSIAGDDAGLPYRLVVFDIAGRAVRELDRGLAKSGRSIVEWNATDESGSRVREGVYFVRFNVGGRMLTRRLVVALR